jgi:hypothetical protein
MLVEACDLPDPRLKMIAGVSMLRRGDEPNRRVIEEAAQQPEVRYWLFQFLGDLARLDLLSQRFQSQGALAEAEMAHWLTWPGELGREPEELELMSVVPIQYEGIDADLYVFRFRDRAEPGEEVEWLAGVAGPYIRGEAPIGHGLGATFSRFEKWESRSAEEHVAAILGNLDDWKDQE